MSSKILTKARLQIFEKHLKQSEPADPVWETWVDENEKTHKRKRELPPGLSKRDAKVLLVRKAKQAEIPDCLLGRMLLNNAFSAGVGLVPFVGDVGVAAFKANSRNAALLEEFLRIRGEEFLKSQKAQGDDDTKGQGTLMRMPKEDLEAVKPGAGDDRGCGGGQEKQDIMEIASRSHVIYS
ncbi:hypothetical protein ACEPAG_7474 [Sanghuangporus baumii]